LATSYQKLADLLWMMQQPQEALRIAGKQVAAAQAVYRAVPEDRDSRKLLASAYTEYGRLQDAANGSNRIFVENERKAVALLESLVATDPQDRQARFLLARAYGFRANAMGDVTDKDAFVLFRKALEISKSLSDLEPRNAEYSKATAGAYNDLGGMLQEMRDLPGAMDNHLRALAVLDGMGASDPKNMQVRRDRATMLCVVGELTVKMGRTAASVPYLEKSVALFESLPAPPNMQVRWGKARVQYDLARAYSQSGNKTGANALYQQCIPEFKDMRSRGLLPALSAEFVDHALADMAKSKPAR
jgi:tetratricopeptide (TPR) repeat protein